MHHKHRYFYLISTFIFQLDILCRYGLESPVSVVHSGLMPAYTRYRPPLAPRCGFFTSGKTRFTSFRSWSYSRHDTQCFCSIHGLDNGLARAYLQVTVPSPRRGDIHLQSVLHCLTYYDLNTILCLPGAALLLHRLLRFYSTVCSRKGSVTDLIIGTIGGDRPTRLVRNPCHW